MKLLVIFVVLLTLPVRAQQPITATVPYAGHLDLDGQPYSGTVRLRFSLFTEPAGGEPVWQEEHDAVEVAAGQFSVGLGARQPVAVHLQRNVQHHLEIEVSDTPADEPAAWVRLSGRQAIAPVPAALWTTQGQLDLEALTARSAEVGALRATTLAGTAGALRVVGDLRIDDTLAAAQVNAAEARFETVALEHLALDAPLEVATGAVLRAPEGSPVALRALGHAEVESLNVTRGATLAGAVRLSGATTIDTIEVDGTYTCQAGDLGPLGAELCTRPGPSAGTHLCYLQRVEDFRQPVGGQWEHGSCGASVVQRQWLMVAERKLCTWQCLRIRP